jgi:hypothetical protein
VVVLRSAPDAIEEMVRLVELAVVAVSIVVEAKGIVEARPSPRMVVVPAPPT